MAYCCLQHGIRDLLDILRYDGLLAVCNLNMRALSLEGAYGCPL
jgi:hypothetical protein